jgi:hypothetical protein
MKHILFYTLGSIVLIMIAFAISSAQVVQQPQQLQPQQGQFQQLKKSTPTPSQPQQGQIQQPQLQVGTQGSYQATKKLLGEPGPYYATPSWDQTLPCTTITNCPRFLVLPNMGNAAVLDKETGLVWEQSPNSSDFSWSSPTIIACR